MEAEIVNGQLKVITHTPPNIHHYELSLDPSTQADSPFMYPTASKKGLAILADAIFIFLGRILAFENFPLRDYIDRLTESIKQFNQIIRTYVAEHGIRKGFFGEKLVELATKSKVIEPASKIKELRPHLEELSAL